MLVPEQDPTRYLPLAQLVLEQVEQAVLDVPEHAPLLYLPDPHAAQVRHVPGLAPRRYWLAPQTTFGGALQSLKHWPCASRCGHVRYSALFRKAAVIVALLMFGFPWHSPSQSRWPVGSGARQRTTLYASIKSARSQGGDGGGGRRLHMYRWKFLPSFSLLNFVLLTSLSTCPVGKFVPHLPPVHVGSTGGRQGGAAL